MCNPRIPAHSPLIDIHQLGKLVRYQMQQSALLRTAPQHTRGHWAACVAPTRCPRPGTCASVVRLRGGERTSTNLRPSTLPTSAQTAAIANAHTRQHTLPPAAGPAAPSCAPIDGRVGSLTSVKGNGEAAQSNSVWMTLPHRGGKWRYPSLRCAPGQHQIRVDAVVQHKKNSCCWNGCHWVALKKGGLPRAQVVGCTENTHRASLPPVAPTPSQTDEGQTLQSGLASVDAGDHCGVPEIERG
ncbi:hypothetical protein DFH08DRAFT_812544 [Mycena albidolilacea]|uniref:Uncharacterized protein n=1 Tax=Mycena albidolilacea TaxID=1033008 RepID=A0AAD6ZUZ5_9AGAR|nr:hypothetical protein DFH08DRAFT_812544 [Mycena albidolilacea]